MERKIFNCPYTDGPDSRHIQNCEDPADAQQNRSPKPVTRPAQRQRRTPLNRTGSSATLGGAQSTAHTSHRP